jgi:hypothetical protein
MYDYYIDCDELLGIVAFKASVSLAIYLNPITNNFPIRSGEPNASHYI